jgi:hypothetical protein
MTYSSDNQTDNKYETLLDEVIDKARRKGAKISSWSQSPNKKIVIHIPGKLPIYYLNMDAAADSLIHQYKLISEYRHLYKNVIDKGKSSFNTNEFQDDQKDILTTQAIYACDAIVQNMDNELSGSTKRKLRDTIDKFISEQNLDHAEFFLLQTALVEHYRDKVNKSSSTQKAKQLQLFTRFLEELSHMDM